MTTAAGRRKRVSPVVTQSTVKGDATMGAADDDEGLDGPEEEEMGEANLKVVRDPGCPSKEEMERHYMTHMPFRSWCPICIQGKAKENPHYRDKVRKQGDKPVVGLDYKSFGQSLKEDDKRTSIVLRDKFSITTRAHVVRCKGTEDAFVVDQLVRDIDEMGHTEIILKGDGEPALVQVMEAIKRRRSHSTILENSPAYDPQSNGAIEKAVDQFTAQLRTIKLGLESRIKAKIDTKWNIVEWMVEHACTTINRGQMGHDGKTPYRRLMGKEASQAMAEFGEVVWAKPLRQKKTNRKIALATRWISGIWVGLTSRSGENLVILPEGGPVIRVRTVVRRPASERWDAKAISDVIALPRLPNPRDTRQEKIEPESMTQGISVDGDSGANLKEPEPAEEQEATRRDFKITKPILERFGYSDACKGCEAVVFGLPPRPHSQSCRHRLEAEMRKDEGHHQRLQQRDERLQRETTPKIEEKIDEAIESGSEDGGDDDENVAGRGTKRGQEEVRPEGPNWNHQGGTASDQSKPSESSEDCSPNKRQRLEMVKKLRKVLANVMRKKVGSVSASHKNEEFADVFVNRDLKPSGSMDITGILCAVMEREARHPHEAEWEERLRYEALYQDMEFWDDIHDGSRLPHDKMVEARMAEMEFFRKMGVYRKVHKSQARGKTIITTRWVDTNKGTDAAPNYRARLVAREIKRDNRLDLFSATPPLEAMKALISKCAHGQKEGMRLAVVDVKRAYFYAPTRREIFIQIPVEDRYPGDEEMIGVLDFSLYGTRDAAQNWAHCYSQVLLAAGFTRGTASVCNFHHAGRQVSITCHGDDFLLTGALKDLQWAIGILKAKFDVKSDILGPEPECVRELRILNRTLRWVNTGIEYEPDARHASTIIKDLRLECSKPLSTPGVANEEDDDPMSGDGKTGTEWQTDTLYRALAARINYLSLDRPDLQFASKGISQFMAKPCRLGWRRLRRLGRYLLGNSTMIQKFQFEQSGNKILADGDSDWAGNKMDRKSTSGGVLRMGSHAIKSWSSTQQTISLSSAESELYAMTKAATQAVGLMQLMQDFGESLSVTVQSDSTAAMAIVSREGLGRTRHIQVQYLWMQQEVAGGRVKVKKVDTKLNTADLLTKHLNADHLGEHLQTLGFRIANVGKRDNILSLTGGGDDWLIGLEDLEDRREELASLGLCDPNADNRVPMGTGSSAVDVCEDGTIRRDVARGLLRRMTSRGYWIRVHKKLRRSAFTPMKVSRGPTSVDQVGEWRITLSRRCSDNSWTIRTDEWRRIDNPHEVTAPFCGFTAFVDEEFLRKYVTYES